MPTFRQVRARHLRLTRLAAVAVLGATLTLACRVDSADESRRELHLSTVSLKRDSAATRAFFETVLADSTQRERLARVILENEGMRHTLSRALVEDSLARAR